MNSREVPQPRPWEQRARELFGGSYSKAEQTLIEKSAIIDSHGGDGTKVIDHILDTLENALKEAKSENEKNGLIQKFIEEELRTHSDYQ